VIDLSEKTMQLAYQAAGVDTEREELAVERLASRAVKTWPKPSEFGGVRLPIGFFANVINLGPFGLAVTTDGVGSKVVIAQMMDRYDTIGIDCVAMNVNDLLCVGATPVSMVDYIALQDANPDLMDQIGIGLCEGAKQARVSISGGETAQLSDLLREGFLGRPAFDLAAAAFGTVPLDRIVVGESLKPGDNLIGIESSGIHSNGLTLARRVLFEQSHFSAGTKLPELDLTLGEELLKPTHIYVQEVVEMLQQVKEIKALIHITSDGFMNLVRVKSDVGYVIDSLLPIPPIFSAIQTRGRISDAEMFEVFNMGVGFCVVVPDDQVDRVVSIARSNGKNAQRIGHVVADKERRVTVEPLGIVGKGKRFRPV
jgi:phosphoribosylformylglycinamidine cyclo-ligase